LGPGQVKTDLSVTARSTGQQLDFWPLGTARSTALRQFACQLIARLTKARTREWTLWSVDCTVDQGQIQRANSLDWSTVRSTGPRPGQACMSVHIGRLRLIKLWTGRPVDRLPIGLGWDFGFENLVFLSIKSHKIS